MLRKYQEWELQFCTQDSLGADILKRLSASPGRTASPSVPLIPSGGIGYRLEGRTFEAIFFSRHAD